MPEGRAEFRAMVRVNGSPVPLRARVLEELLRELGYEAGRQGIAVAVNDEVVPRGRWTSLELRPGDVIEVVGAVQGG